MAKRMLFRKYRQLDRLKYFSNQENTKIINEEAKYLSRLQFYFQKDPRNLRSVR